MQAKVWAKLGMVVLAAALVTGCGNRNREPQLMNVRANIDTPDEFAILPARPLEQPEDYAALPEPTPGGTNRTDPTPREDAVAALGGNPAAVARAGIPASDSALLSHTRRYGVTPSIRDDLAAFDLEYRRANDGRLLERVFRLNVYYRAYAEMSLDQHAELERWRSRMVRTPSAPPDPEVDY